MCVGSRWSEKSDSLDSLDSLAHERRGRPTWHGAFGELTDAGWSRDHLAHANAREAGLDLGGVFQTADVTIAVDEQVAVTMLGIRDGGQEADDRIAVHASGIAWGPVEVVLVEVAAIKGHSEPNRVRCVILR